MLPKLIALAFAAAVGPAFAEANEAVGATLHWTDNASNEAGFQIERRDGNVEWSIIATVGEDVVSYADRSVEPGKTYQYRVCAFNSAGLSAYATPVTYEAPLPATYLDWAATHLSNVALDDPMAQPYATVPGFDYANVIRYAYALDSDRPDLDLLPRMVVYERDGSPQPAIEHALSKIAGATRTHLLISRDLIEWEPSAASPVTLRENATHRWERIDLPVFDHGCLAKLEYTLASE